VGGGIAQGSGFFTDEPGLIITNAHVLQMLDPESRPPAKIEVTLHSGTNRSRTLIGRVVGVDRGTDLGLVRVLGKDLPDPLALGTTRGLTETQGLYVFGFPFGVALGKEITVSRTSVSSLRKSGESVSAVQLDGGMNPGNSGGPVVNEDSQVIGVAVSGVRGTAIGKAIPAESVGRFLNGRIVGSSADVPYRDGDKVMLPVTFDLIDPLGRLKNVEFQIWTGNPGPPRPASAKEPASRAGDSAKTRHKMLYDKRPSVTLAVPAAALAVKQVYWIQPIITNGVGETRWVAATTVPPKPPVDRKALSLAYKPPVGGRRTAEITSNGDFQVRNSDGEQSAVGINLTSGFTETFSTESRESFPMRLTYDRFGLVIKVDNKPVTKDAELRKAQGDIRLAAAEVQMDKGGGMSSAKLDLLRVPRPSQAAIAELSTQMLQSVEMLTIPLPTKKMEAEETWKSQRTFLIGSAIIAVPVHADVTYQYLGVQTRDKTDGALIRISGRVKGRQGDGLDVAGTVRGSAFVSLETGEVLSADVTVKADMDVAFERKKSKALATLAVSMKRPIPSTK
jgi:Trypsin-like peptidase domain